MQLRLERSVMSSPLMIRSPSMVASLFGQSQVKVSIWAWEVKVWVGSMLSHIGLVEITPSFSHSKSSLTSSSVNGLFR